MLVSTGTRCSGSRGETLESAPKLVALGARPATPRIYYGWIILAALAVTEPTSWGVVYYAFGVLLGPMQNEFGWDQAYLTGAFSLAVLVSAIAAIPVGWVLDRYGARALMTLGSAGAVVLVLAWASAKSLVEFYTIWIGLGVVMAAVLYEPAFAVVATWFHRDRTKAMTLLTLAGGLASPIFVPLTAWLAGQWGWRTALVVLALILAVVTIPVHALTLRRRPSDLGLQPAEPGGEGERGLHADVQRCVEPSVVFRSAGFWWLTAAFWFLTFANMAVSVHMIPLLLDRDLGAGTAVTAAALVGGMQIPGRLLLAPLERRVSPRVVSLSVFFLQTVGLVVLLLAHGAAGVFVFAALFGVGAGASTLVRATIVARLYGVRNYGRISGVLALCATSAKALAPIAASLGYGLVGGYQGVLSGLVVVSVTAVVALYFVERDVPETSRDTAAKAYSACSRADGSTIERLRCVVRSKRRSLHS